MRGGSGFPMPAKNEKGPSVEQWASQIRSVWAKGATNTLELARLVFRARRTMRYGDWAQMLRSKQLPFAKSKSKMLVCIGEQLGDLDGQTFGHLPSGWSILYCLSLLGVSTVKQLIEEGIIHPRLTLRESRELLAKHRGDKDKSKKLKVSRRLRSFRDFVLETLEEWTTAECELAVAELAQLAARITTRERRLDTDRLYSSNRLAPLSWPLSETAILKASSLEVCF